MGSSHGRYNTREVRHLYTFPGWGPRKRVSNSFLLFTQEVRNEGALEECGVFIINQKKKNLYMIAIPEGYHFVSICLKYLKGISLFQYL